MKHVEWGADLTKLDSVRRFHQLLFAVSLLALCWMGMMAVHELGHVMGAIGTGGSVERVVLQPLRISRTDVAPNPQPGVVVWLGPLVGCIVPLVISVVVPHKFLIGRNVARFFAGFCLIANGAYISIGAFEGVGDCGEMLRTGTPFWVLIAFGIITISMGLLIWHRLGSPRRLFNESSVTPMMAYGVFAALLACIVATMTFSSA